MAAGRVVGHYQVAKVVGKGGFGEALLVKDLQNVSGEMRIAKRMDLANKSKKEIDSAMTEVQLLAKFSDHPFIVRYYEAFIKYPSLYVIMDYCEKGDLQKLLDHRKNKGQFLNEEQVMKYFAQVVVAIEHMHNNKVLHRDIKLANILVDKNSRIRVADFGISKFLVGQELAKTQIGTPMFMGPEILSGQAYAYASDVWSLGCVLYQMISLELPFNGVCMMGLVNSIKYGKVKPLSKVSIELRELCYSMLDKVPAKRPTVKQIVQHKLVQRALASLLSKSMK